MSKSLIYVRTYLVRFIIIVGLLSALASWYLVSPQVDTIFNELSIWNMMISTFTLFVGLLTVFSRYITNIMRHGAYWPYQCYALIVIIVWIIMGLTKGIYSDIYQTAFLSTKITLHIAILGQLIFFMVSGAYRVFRMRNIRTALFAICAASVATLNSPWLLGIYPEADKISFWLLNNPAMAGQRALVISGAIGGLFLGFRILFGLERGALRVTEA